ncbi:hypothetical protein ABVK25_011863 [Lepraria finkii]|uniref:Uncharacterized protein n=1 Tax=Lepraria finkii TaxID=1340010 RepID=A0ABR4AJM6_9LECA
MADTLNPPPPAHSLSSLNNASGTSSPPRLSPTLPELPYSLRDHKRSIALIWTLFALDAAIIPLALFYSLWYATSLAPAYIFAITTGMFGIISGIEWVIRSRQLWKKEDVRPFGGKRNGFDFFHISYSTGYAISLVELIVGAAPQDPFIRLCAMPAPSFILFFGGELLLFSIFSTLKIPNPFKISSQPKGALVRPGIYTVIEDVIAVGTGAGRAYRRAINDRYEASPMFRRMLWQLNMFWAVPALAVGAGVTAVVADDRVPQTVAYGIGWGVPPLWVGIWALITIQWVQISLRREKEAWSKEGRV